MEAEIFYLAIDSCHTQTIIFRLPIIFWGPDVMVSVLLKIYNLFGPLKMSFTLVSFVSISITSTQD